MASNIVDRTPLVHRYSKEMLEDVATEFLTQYCSEALEKPMAVPILDIARKKMGLKVITNYRLSEDFSILGQMCFTSGVVDIYDKEEDEFRELKVRRGTMLIDPDILEKRNEGCFNNTVAHESFHWYKHRNYFLEKKMNERYTYASYRTTLESETSDIHSDWTDIDWIEWQANNAAPRILMPRETFQQAAQDIFNDGYLHYGDNLQEWWVISRLAELYDVSKQSAEIRMRELGILI